MCVAHFSFRISPDSPFFSVLIMIYWTLNSWEPNRAGEIVDGESEDH